MMEDPTLSLDKESLAILMSWHSAGAIAGKLITGSSADLLGGRKMFLLALAFTGAANIEAALCTSFIGFAIFNFFGQFSKAGGWPAMDKIVRSGTPESKYAAFGVSSPPARVGTIAAGLALGYLLMFMSWRAVLLHPLFLSAVWPRGSISLCMIVLTRSRWYSTRRILGESSHEKHRQSTQD